MPRPDGQTQLTPVLSHLAASGNQHFANVDCGVAARGSVNAVSTGPTDNINTISTAATGVISATRSTVEGVVAGWIVAGASVAGADMPEHALHAGRGPKPNPNRGTPSGFRIGDRERFELQLAAAFVGTRNLQDTLDLAVREFLMGMHWSAVGQTGVRAAVG